MTGRLYNGVSMPPYALPEGKTRTAIQTASTPGGGGANEIRFEDKAGSEEIMIHAQYDTKTVAANNAKGTSATTRRRSSGTTRQSRSAPTRTSKITKGSQNSRARTRRSPSAATATSRSTRSTALTVEGQRDTTVGGNHFEMDGNPLEALIAHRGREGGGSSRSAMANNAIAAVRAGRRRHHQVMAPINGLTQKAEGVAGAMQAVAGGDMSRMPGMIAGASGIPGASSSRRRWAGAGRRPGGGGGGAAGGCAGGAAPNMLASIGVERGAERLAGKVFVKPEALASALGIDAGGGGGESAANVAGRKATSMASTPPTARRGPGTRPPRSPGTHKENVGSMKVLGAVQDIDNNVDRQEDNRRRRRDRAVVVRQLRGDRRGLEDARRRWAWSSSAKAARARQVTGSQAPRWWAARSSTSSRGLTWCRPWGLRRSSGPSTRWRRRAPSSSSAAPARW